MTIGERPRLTWSRLGIGISVGLVLFGAIDAALPHSARPGVPISGVGPHETRGPAIATATTPLTAVQGSAAQQVAEEFVKATDTTDPTHPEGDTAERARTGPSPDRAATSDVAGGLGGRRPKDDGGARPARSSRSSRFRPGCRGRHWPDGRDHRYRPDLGGAGRRAGHAAPHRPAGSPNASHWVVTDVGSGS